MPDRVGVIAASCYVLAAAAIVAVSPPPALAAVCLAPLVLIAPGYALQLALRTERDPRGAGVRWLRSVTFSMAAVVLGGLILNALSSLTAAAWAGWLVSLTCVLSAVAWLRRRGTAPSARRRVSLPSSRTVATGLAAAVLVGSALALTEVNARRTFDTPVTQLSLVPVRVQRALLRLSVTNLSSTTERIALTVTEGRRLTRTIRLAVGPNQTWSRLIFATGTVTAALRVPARGTAAQFTEVSWAPAGGRTGGLA